jgi:hypothetical protein
MIDYMLWIVVVSFWCWGFNNAFSEGHIFEKAGDWLDEHLPEKLNKPLWACPICMVSVHGSIWYFITQDFNFIQYVLFIVAISGLNTIIYKLTKKDED